MELERKSAFENLEPRLALSVTQLAENSGLPESWTPPDNEPTDILEWYQHRGNKRLTGEATIHQDLVSDAEVLWSQFIGSREVWFGLQAAAGDTTLALPDDNLTLSQSESVSWGLNGPYFDLSGTGSLTSQPTSSLLRIGDFIPGNGVLEKLEGEVFDTTFGQGVIRLYTFEGGWVEQWESPVIPSMFSVPNIIVGDFDDDGGLEVAITPWNDLYLLDMETGQVEQNVTFKPASNQSGRPYGWLGAYDFTGDGREEFVLLGDFQDFIAVMGWNATGNLVKLWEHVIDPRLSDKQTTHRPGAFPVRDVTGNGRLEIVSTIFNESGDNRWHIVIRDALTGAAIHDLADHAIDSAQDIDDDGDFELFVRTTQGALLSETSTLKILDWSGAGFTTSWTQSQAGFISQDISDFPLFANSATSTGKLDLLTGSLSSGEAHVFFTRKVLDPSTNLTSIDAWQFDSAGGVESFASATGTRLDVLAVREADINMSGILLATELVGSGQLLTGDYNGNGRVDSGDYTVWRDTLNDFVPSGTGADGNFSGVIDQADYTLWKDHFGSIDTGVVRVRGLNGEAVYAQTAAPPRSSAVVGRLAGSTSTPTVIIQGGGESIVAVTPQIDGQVETLWTRAGIGAFFGATQNQGQHQNSGVALGDVTGNGQLETLYATTGEAGQARLVAAAPGGSEVWHADFDVPGGTRVFNEPGLTLWRTGHFTTTEYEDVLVQIIRGIGGTGELHLLDGQSGEIIWMREYGNTPGSNSIQRGASEAHMAVYDWDGDGLDEAVNFNPDMFYVLDGDGSNLIDKSVFNGGVFPGGSPLFGAPVVADFLNNGTDSILFAGSYSQFGIVDKNAVPIWNTPFVFDNTPGFMQGVGDVDGDGDLDILSPGHPIAPATHTVSQFHAYDAATGQLLWEVDLPGRPHAPVGGAYFDTPTLSVSADIDDDGRVESVFAIGNTLYAVGASQDGSSGRIEWTFTPDGGLLGSPVIADGNGDGIAEIIVVSTSGFVYGIGNATDATANVTRHASGTADAAFSQWIYAIDLGTSQSPSPVRSPSSQQSPERPSARDLLGVVGKQRPVDPELARSTSHSLHHVVREMRNLDQNVVATIWRDVDNWLDDGFETSISRGVHEP